MMKPGVMENDLQTAEVDSIDAVRAGIMIGQINALPVEAPPRGHALAAWSATRKKVA